MTSCKFKRVCIAEHSRLGGLMTSDSWKGNAWRFLSSWSPILPKAPQAKLLHQVEYKVSLNSRKSWQLPEVTHWWGRWQCPHGNTSRDRDQAVNSRIPQFLSDIAAIAGEEHLHHSTSCSPLVCLDTPQSPPQLFSASMLSVSLSSFLHGQFSVTTAAKVQSRTQISTPANCLLAMVGLNWSFTHFHWSARTANVAGQSCSYVDFFLFFLLKKG